MSVSDRDLVRLHVNELLVKGEALGLTQERMAALLFETVLALWKTHRDNDDIASELSFAIENLGDDEDFAFMRP